MVCCFEKLIEWTVSRMVLFPDLMPNMLTFFFAIQLFTHFWWTSLASIFHRVGERGQSASLPVFSC